MFGKINLLISTLLSQLFHPRRFQAGLLVGAILLLAGSMPPAIAPLERADAPLAKKVIPVEEVVREITTNALIESQKEIENLAVAADHISISRVQNIHSQWNEDKQTFESVVTLLIQEYLKGTHLPPNFTVTLDNTLIDSLDSAVRAWSPGVNLRVLLFLKNDSVPGTLLTNNWQSVYYIEGYEAVQPETKERLSLAGLKSRIRAVTPTVPAPAYAGALLLKRSVEELATESDRIIVADVLRVESEFNVDRSNIFTFVTLDVDKVLKGHSNAQATLVLPGGEADGITLLVGGVPNFVAGERVLLFLDENSEFGITGLWQGKYSLSGNEAFQPETGQTVSVASLEQAIGKALNAPVEIGTSPELVHAEFTISCDAWDTTNNTFPINHYVNPNNPGTGAPTGNSFVSVMYDALNAWQALSNSWVTLRIAGTTTRGATAHFDGNNDIAWANLTGGVLGINYCAMIGGQRIDSDTQFDNSDRIWTITAEAGKFDLRAVAEHEFGHGIGIGHSDQFCNGSASTPLMCAFVSSGVRKTILTDDSNAAQSLYPLSGPAPNAPSNLSITAAAGTSNSLSWTDNAGNEHAFEVQRASSNCGGTFKGIVTLPANTTTYTDDDYGVGLPTSVYCYRVKALNKGGDSGFSNTALTSPLAVNKALVSTNLITASANITYNLTIVNYASNPVTNITLNDAIPAKTTYVSGSAVASPGIVNLATFPTSTPPFTMSGSSTVVITYVLQVTNTAKRGDILMNTATISAPALLGVVQASSLNYVDPYQNYLPVIIKN